MKTKFKSISIEGIACVVPNRIFDNFEYCEKTGSKRTKRQVQLTGIKRRHICGKGQRASDLCTKAAERLMKKLDWKPNEINALIFVTQTPDLDTPSTAMLIQKRLGIGQQCFCFDVNLGCSGYVGGLNVILSILSSCGGKGLLLAGDGYYQELNDEIKANDLLFGDCGSATAVSYSETGNDNILYSSMNTDGTRFDYICTPKGESSQMKGNEVLIFSLNEVSESIKAFQNYYQIDKDKIDFYAFHQAQKIILDGIANECGIEEDKILISYENYGNTQSASIPLSICANLEKYEKDEINFFMCGFGVGLSWGNVCVTVNKNRIYSVEQTEEYYDDITVKGEKE